MFDPQKLQFFFCVLFATLGHFALARIRRTLDPCIGIAINLTPQSLSWVVIKFMIAGGPNYLMVQPILQDSGL